VLGVRSDSRDEVLHPTHNQHDNAIHRTFGETATLVAKLVGWFFAWVGLGFCWDYPGQRMDEIKAELWPEEGLPATYYATESEQLLPDSPTVYGSGETPLITMSSHETISSLQEVDEEFRISDPSQIPEQVIPAVAKAIQTKQAQIEIPVQINHQVATFILDLENGKVHTVSPKKLKGLESFHERLTYALYYDLNRLIGHQKRPAALAFFLALSREEPISKEMLQALGQELSLAHPIYRLANSYVHEVQSLENLQKKLKGLAFEVKNELKSATISTLPNYFREIISAILSEDDEHVYRLDIQRLEQAVESELESWKTGGKRARVRNQLLNSLEREINHAGREFNPYKNGVFHTKEYTT